MHAEKGIAAHLDTHRLTAHGHSPQHGHHIRTAQAQCQEVWSDYRFIHSIHRGFLSALECYLTSAWWSVTAHLTSASLAGAQYLSKREMGVDIGRATTRAHPPHPLPARPYYTANRPAKPAYSRGRGGCRRGGGALVAARPCPPHLFSLFERYWATTRD